MIALVPLFVVATVACVALVACIVAQERHSVQVSGLLAAVAAERYAWARERWELNTRLQAPEVVRAAPPAPPAATPPAEVLQALNVLQQVAEPEPLDEDDLDESYLIGTGPEVGRPESA